MSFPKLTGSRFGLAADCPGSHAQAWTKSISDAADDGTSIHAFIRRALSGDVDGALEVAPPEVAERCDRIDIVKIAEIGWSEFEVAFAYDAENDTAVELGTDLDRDYSKAPERSVPMTIDALAVVDGVAHVNDWKSGRVAVDHPRYNWQVKLGALAVTRARKLNSAVGYIGKVPEFGRQMFMSAAWDEIALDGFASEARRVVQRVTASRLMVEDGRRPELVEGEHCRYCPAWRVCPALSEAGQALVPMVERAESLDPAGVARAWAFVRAVEPAVEKMKKILQDWARAEPIHLPNGKVIREIVSHRESLVLSVAAECAAEAGLDSDQILDAASVSKESLKKAFGEEVAADLIDRMRKAGGVRDATRKEVREVRQ